MIVQHSPHEHLVGGGGIPYEIKSKSGWLAASTAATDLIAAVSDKKIRVISLILTSAAAATSATTRTGIHFYSASTRLYLSTVDVLNPIILPPNAIGWMTTATGAALRVETGAGETLDYALQYIEMQP